MKSGVALAGIAVLSAAACTQRGPAPSVAATPRCTSVGGFAERVCPVSLLAVVAAPERFDGRVIAIEAPVVDIEGRIYAFGSEEKAKSRHIQDAIECISTPSAECAGQVGSSATLFGRFRASPASTDFLFQPAGTIELLKVRGARPTGAGSAR